MHETGHALHDLGVPREWRTQPVGSGLGVALEESQSLLFEMIVCRRRAFLVCLRPLLEKHFGVSGPEWEVGEPVPAAHPRAAQRHPRGRR